MKLYSNILNSEVQLLIYESILPCFLLICIVNLSIIILLSLLNIPHPKKNSSFKNYKITLVSKSIFILLNNSINSYHYKYHISYWEYKNKLFLNKDVIYLIQDIVIVYLKTHFLLSQIDIRVADTVCVQKPIA